MNEEPTELSEEELSEGDSENNTDKSEEDETEEEIAHNDEDVYSCTIFIAVKNSFPEKVTYSMVLSNRRYATELTEGVTQQYDLFYVDGYMNFYYKPTNYNHTVNFNLFSYSGRTKYNVKIWKNTE